MITFFKKGAKTIFAVESDHKLSAQEVEKFYWLFDGAKEHEIVELLKQAGLSEDGKTVTTDQLKDKLLNTQKTSAKITKPSRQIIPIV